MLKVLTGAGLVLAAALLGAAPALPAPEPPFSFDTAPGRLPKTVLPVEYRVSIAPDVAAKTIAGSEAILLDVRAATTTIVFNSLHEQLRDVRLDGAPAAAATSDDARQLTTVTLARAATPGRHTLSFAYTGKIETAPQGLFAQRYRTAGGATSTLLSTQFEATDARRMFPCWDEPAFRATFALTATVPASWATVSNMPVASRNVRGALATVAFAPSPKMPSYLVEFSAGDLAHIEASADGVRHEVWAPAGRQSAGAYALASSQQILADYDAYFGTRFPLPKLAHIAVPGGFHGAMENWGAITYNDQALLYPAGSTLAQKERVFSIMAHEMAHQWNGDLVTMAWWDDIWLNESFASWMAAKETALRNPDWNWAQRDDATKERAMNADARVTSHPIQQHVSDELQAEASFDSEITYGKGEAVLRMLEAYLTPETFRAGIRRYVQAHAYSNATSTDLWNALSAASGSNVAAVASGWTEQPGFPLVTVSARCDAAGARTLALTQKRFLLAGTPGSERWSIPLAVRSGTSGPVHDLLLTTDGQTVSAGRCGEALSLNADDIGFFRTAFDAQTFATNAKSFASLPAPERIAMLDDQWALVASGHAQLGDYLALASNMGADVNARAWSQLLGALGVIAADERGAAGEARFLAYARTIVHPLLERLGWTVQRDEPPTQQDLRRSAIAALGAWNDPAVVGQARTRFATFLTDRSSISPDDQPTILGIVAQHADAATFDRLHALARSSKDETEVRRYYGALAEVRDPKLAAAALQLALSPEIPPQAGFLRSTMVATVARSNPRLAWQFFQQNYPALMASRSEFEQTLALSGVAEQYWNAAPLAEVERWIKARVPARAGVYVERGLERARFDLALKDRIVPEADAFVAAHSGGAMSARTR